MCIFSSLLFYFCLLFLLLQCLSFSGLTLLFEGQKDTRPVKSPAVAEYQIGLHVIHFERPDLSQTRLD